ncbi:MAG TPA: hypothetical protein VHC49_23000 [Mycobacteriales bacterium]|nr:hypothetical protein [Mycobacteriales bacterium]
MTLHWGSGVAQLCLYGNWAEDADARFAEIGDVLLGNRISVVNVDVTETHPYASPSCLRALLCLRARLRRSGTQVHIHRRLHESATALRQVS